MYSSFARLYILVLFCFGLSACLMLFLFCFLSACLLFFLFCFLYLYLFFCFILLFFYLP